MFLSVIKECSCFPIKCVAWSLSVFISKVGLILPNLGLLYGLEERMDVSVGDACLTAETRILGLPLCKLNKFTSLFCVFLSLKN